MKKTNLTFFIIALLTLGACSEKCDEPDVQYINGIHLELQNGGDNGFSQEELNAIFFVRYVPFSEPIIADTLYANGYFPEGPGKFTINDRYPFYNDQSPYYTVYGYMIIDPTTGFVANIEDIKLTGHYDGDCGYVNTRKTFTLNMDTIDVSGLDSYYVLTR